MYNINMYQFQEKPYCNAREYYIFPLNAVGVEKYTSKEGHPASYLNRLNPAIFSQIVAEGPESSLPPLTSQSQCGNNRIQQGNGTQDRSSTDKEHLGPLSLDDVNVNNKDRPPVKAKPRQYCKLFNGSSSALKANDIVPFEQRLKQQKKYFAALHKKMDFEDIFGYPQPKKQKTRKDKYEREIDSLKENLSVKEIDNDCNSNKLMCARKAINGGIPIPRIDRKEAPGKEANPFNLFTMNMNRSLSIPHCNVLNEKENSDVIQRNNVLEKTLNQQTDSAFLQNSKLPALTKVISTKQVISNSIGNTKFLGAKYNPYSFTNNAHGHYTRNYIGGKYNH